MSANPLYQWYELQLQLKELKKQELTLRREVFEMYFPDPDEGANRVEVEGGAHLVGTLPYRYTLDEAAVEEALEHVPKTKREKLITYQPKMSLAVFRKLNAKARDNFANDALTITPGTPSLKIEPPKADEPEH
jgi:hypothetical protein